MSITKHYLKTKPVCKVTFKISAEQLAGAETVALLGEFNDWDPAALPMKKSKKGDFSASVTLNNDQEYQFRYLVNGGTWLNDDAADAYLPSPLSYDHNSVIRL
ncbi:MULTISPECIES: isoamylase early set domain-containing protein [unclassified Arsukibacterium]|mgnify:CR=1 FL=1|uniref:isoamylase early set domain-containing protein n=1 Tax=unclassified Arsukibacterium TaxID=2635278 RepID=UPI000C8D1C1B|nr:MULTISPECIES: isoamylase early set domain-containing protein [unclassified Arsukibacterium]MAA93707.1 glycoside hydrolase [Rheinheimera sp.]HAW92022.1 glycoside hydrolase [Candidatus Azambacteria bacterium]|tara:strand:+ start:474 stop:782 length:309 start_codon:yes stop_codon:yes gene_type:complete